MNEEGNQVKDEERVKKPIHLSKRVNELVNEIAHRRYGNKPFARDDVIDDALNWRIDKWNQEGASFLDLFWLAMRNCPISFFQAFAWGKLIDPYFEGMVPRH